MALSINFPDKIIAGLNQSYTVLSVTGEPTGEVRVGGTVVPHRVIHLGQPKTSTGETPPEVKYKISFLIPEDAVGKSLEVRLQAGADSAVESKEISAD